MPEKSKSPQKKTTASAAQKAPAKKQATPKPGADIKPRQS